MEKIKKGLRMYFFVPYNISYIQKGIQAGHCAEQFARKYSNSIQWREYVDYHKTWIILNGGTTNTSFVKETRGSLNEILDELILLNIEHSSFYEPDLNNALTAVCFLVDEKVWDFNNYPIYKEWCWLQSQENENFEYDATTFIDDPSEDYIKFIGGSSNLFYKKLIYMKKLA